MNEELLSYKKYINFNNKNIYDIGANTGEMTDFFKINSKNSTIYSVEPHKSNIQILKKKFKDYTNIKIIEGAVNIYTGTCNIGHEQQQRINGLKQGHVMINIDKDLQKRKWKECLIKYGSKKRDKVGGPRRIMPPNMQ